MTNAKTSGASRRLLFRTAGAAVVSGAALAALAGRGAFSRSAATSNTNLHESAPTQFQQVGDVRLAYRRFGKVGALPLICLQHFTGTMDNWDPVHTNRLARDRPVVLVDYRGVGRSTGNTPDSMQALAHDNMRNNDGDACSRAVLAAGSPAEAIAITLALYRACWSEGKVLATTDDILAVIAAAGLDPAPIAARIDAPDLVAQLDANTDEAAERGVFGSPMIFVGDAMFFGNDRLDFVREELARLEEAV